MSHPTLSVIVPVYNGAKTLEAALSSVLADPAVTELIVVDDGSDDDSAKRALALSHPALRLISTPHRGLSAARNRGIEEATGDYIAFLDCDDTASTAFYTTLLSCAERTGADCVAGDIFLTDRARMIPSGFPTLGEGTALRETMTDFYPAVWNKLYRRGTLSDLRFREGELFEDVEFSHRLLFRCRRIAACHGGSIRYRHGTLSTRRDEALFAYPRAVAAIVEEAASLPDAALWRDEVEFVACRYLLATFLRRAACLPRPLWQRAKGEALGLLQSRFPQWRRNPYLKKKGALGLYLRCFTPALARLFGKETE